MPRTWTLIGAPTSAGAHHAGQELAPAALRERGLVTELRRAGVEVIDTGDIEGDTWQPDAVDSPARNLRPVWRVARRVADAVEREVRFGRTPIVLGGDCTVTLGVIAGVQRARGEIRVAYFDGDADLRAPDAEGSGILDATGVAHLLGIATTPLARIGPRAPALSPDQLALVGFDPDDPDSFDAGAVASRPTMFAADYRELRADPSAVATKARDFVGRGGSPVVVHFDVDAVDSRDLALADFPHYTTGVTVAVARQVLRTLLSVPTLAALSLTEVNPTHDPAGTQLDRYIDLVAGALAP